MRSEKSQRTQNGTMFVDLDWPLNASRRLSASAELLVSFVTVHFWSSVTDAETDVVSIHSLRHVTRIYTMYRMHYQDYSLLMREHFGLHCRCRRLDTCLEITAPQFSKMRFGFGVFSQPNLGVFFAELRRIGLKLRRPRHASLGGIDVAMSRWNPNSHFALMRHLPRASSGPCLDPSVFHSHWWLSPLILARLLQ